MNDQISRVLAVIVVGFALASCTGTDSADQSSTSTTDTTEKAPEPSTTATTAAESSEPVSGHCESGPGGFVDDEPGDVPAGLDVASADIRADGDNLVATITLAGSHTKVTTEAPGEGFWHVSLGADTWSEYQISASLIDGQEDYGVFDSEAAKNKPARGSMEGNVVTITTPLDMVPGFGAGWVWNAGSEAGIMTLVTDRCPGPGNDDVLTLGQP